ncbi:MAG: FAD-dependent oxidoreductase [Lachnospiraceae bacterium]|nr:FAD-dependent oxidoreductase [Lachnospiraceae bacterium]
MVDVFIIGAGTAGLSAGIYAAREGLKTHILEHKVYGGQIVNSPVIKNYPGMKEVSGYDFATALYEQAKQEGVTVDFSGVDQVTKDERGFFRIQSGDTVHEAKTVVVATGAANRRLGLDREQELIGRGVSYCATCDGAFFRGKKVAVNGGGNTAVMDAIFLAGYCEKVYLIHRREEFRAEQQLLDQAKEIDNIQFITGATVARLEGEEVLKGLELNFNNGSIDEIAVSGLFVAIGQVPETSAVQSLVALDPSGYVVAGEDCRTTTEGVFAAGDCRTKDVRQLVTAAADGAVAALAAAKYIRASL